MPRWKYAAIQVMRGELQDKLSEWGAEGWELMTVVPIQARIDERFSNISNAYIREYIEVESYAVVFKAPAEQ